MTALRKVNAKRDANEPEIVRALKDMGVLVHRLDQPFDLLCCVFKSRKERLILIEVKQPGRELNVNQKQSALAGWPVHVIRTVDEAIDLIKSMREAA